MPTVFGRRLGLQNCASVNSNVLEMGYNALLLLNYYRCRKATFTTQYDLVNPFWKG